MDRIQIETANRISQVEASQDHFACRLKELKAYEDANLIKATRADGRTYYYLYDRDTGKRRYLGKDSKEVVKLIKEAHYCKTFVDTAKRDLVLLRKVLKEYKPLDYVSLNDSMAKAYRGAEVTLKSGAHPDRRAADWIERKTALKNRVVEKYKDDLKHRAADGTMVRSKSEVIIADMLYMNNIPYVYEVPYFFDGEILNLDFTALSTVDYETEIAIEHQGMMDMQAYRDKYMHTLMTCLRNGMVPNVDIFFTFDDLDGSFDSRQVWDIINSRLLIDQVKWNPKSL